jgi:hypothetical protein
MDTTGGVDSYQKITEGQGGFTGDLGGNDLFGCAVDGLNDMNADGVPDLIVGAYLDDDGETNGGAAWLLFMNADGTVQFHNKISSTQGNFQADIDKNDFFGTGVATIGDLDNNCIDDLFIGVIKDDPFTNLQQTNDYGATYTLFLEDLTLPLRSKPVAGFLISPEPQSDNLPTEASGSDLNQEAIEMSLIDDVYFQSFPNPTEGILNLIFKDTDEINKIVDIEIFNLLGVRVYNEQKSLNGYLTHSVNLGDQTGGQYILKIRVGNHVMNKTITLIK